VFEVEAKGSIGTMTEVEILRALQTAGISLSRGVRQVDRVYARRKGDITQPFPGVVIARIRLEDSVVTFNVKKHLSNELECIEHEVVVSDQRSMTEILELFDFQEIACVEKVRRIGRLGESSICLDNVERLGWFVELEEMYLEPPPRDAQTDLERRLGEIFGEAYSPVRRGYDRLLLDRSRNDGI
jgi:adenylate cyclase class 2